MRCALLGPVVADLDLVGLDSKRLTIATAFYTRRRLETLCINAAHVDLLVRLNTSDLSEWIHGSIDPQALLEFCARLIDTSVNVRLFVSPTAHAKVYMGSRGFLIGSANLTERGFGGLASEVLWYERRRGAVREMTSTLARYRARLSELALADLERFVTRNQERVRKHRVKNPRPVGPAENRLPTTVIRPARLGDFDDFVKWLDRHKGNAYQLIARRARGEGQLSGHIKRNFFGLRQFFINHPERMQEALHKDPGHYALHRDPAMQGALRSFVRKEAQDEDALSVETWCTYLPESVGGKPKSGGGTSGNLKRMVPLVARYLKWTLIEDSNERGAV